MMAKSKALFNHPKLYLIIQSFF